MFSTEDMYRVLTEKFSLGEVKDLVADLNMEWDHDLSGKNNAQKIKDFVRIMKEDKATDQLLDMISNYGKSDINLNQFLHLVIAESLPRDIDKLYTKCGFALTYEELKSFGNNLDLQLILAKRLQTQMENCDGESYLIQAIKELNSDLMLDWYV